MKAFLKTKNVFLFCRIRGSRSKQTCAVITVFGLIFLFAVVNKSLKFYHQLFSCSTDQETVVIKSICELHTQNKAFGSLCDSMCLKKQLEPVNCIVHHTGKEIVFIARLNGENVVVKSTHLDPTHYDQIYFTDNTNSPVYPDLDFFVDMLIQSVMYNLNRSISISPKTNIVDLVWTESFTYLERLSSSHQHAAMSNIWHLVQQPEYVLSKLYASHNIFPNVVGTCGHMYVVEFLKPLDNFFSVLHPSWRYSFSTRAKWALDLIQLFQSFDSAFHSVLHICDVKIGHFGFSKKGTLHLLDLDMAIFEETLKTDMMAPSSCQKDKDCAFIDCHGFCKKGHCQSNITNNNLQRLCSNLLYGYVGQDLFGLLGSVPPEVHKKGLKYLLLLCMKSPSSAPMAIKSIKKILKAVGQKS